MFLILIFSIFFNHHLYSYTNDEDVKVLSDSLSRHKPIYFIMGKPEAKVQVSLKYKFLSKNVPLYIGYTQLMSWRLGEKSSPFTDLNYNPEFFYRLSITDTFDLTSIDIGFLEHKSNGKAGSDSRSWNTSFLRFNSKFCFGEFALRWQTKLYTFYILDSTNSDIRNYKGFFSTRFSFSNFYSEFFSFSEIYFKFFFGGKFSTVPSKGAQEMGIVLKPRWGQFNPGFIFQIYHGYGEFQIDYNKSYTAYRAGIIF